MDFEDVYEMLEAVRQHPLTGRERIIPLNSVNGTRVGYTTADGEQQAVTWTIGAKTAKASAIARGSRESQRIRELLGSYMGRRQLLDELRAGTLDYGLAQMPIEHQDAPHGPRQCLIPGL